MKTQLKTGDFFVMALVVLLAIGLTLPLWFARQETTICVIWQAHDKIATLPVNEDTTYVVEGTYQNVITIQDGVVTMTSATCPNQHCVHSSSIDTVGQSIVCLPNQVVVELVGGHAQEVDVIVS